MLKIFLVVAVYVAVVLALGFVLALTAPRGDVDRELDDDD